MNVCELLEEERIDMCHLFIQRVAKKVKKGGKVLVIIDKASETELELKREKQLGRLLVSGPLTITPLHFVVVIINILNIIVIIFVITSYPH